MNNIYWYDEIIFFNVLFADITCILLFFLYKLLNKIYYGIGRINLDEEKED